MREAMAEAEVGDDVFRDDPTVIRLEELAAGMVGKEAALFVPSGTMGNLIALLVHCQRGEEAIVGSLSHIYLNEAGGMSALGGIQPCPIQNQKDGTLAPDDILSSIRTEDVHHPISRLVCLENTQNISSGEVCFLCHSFAVYVTTESSTATNFRNQTKNLHTLHSGKRTACYTCHDTHGSEQLHLININANEATIPAGRNSQTAPYPTATGGGCYLACHGTEHNPDTYSR